MSEMKSLKDCVPSFTHDEKVALLAVEKAEGMDETLELWFTIVDGTRELRRRGLDSQALKLHMNGLAFEFRTKQSPQAVTLIRAMIRSAIAQTEPIA